jgi:mannose-6-phosphate isomerase-like protein (cupin superfamily)
MTKDFLEEIETERTKGNSKFPKMVAEATERLSQLLEAQRGFFLADFKAMALRNKYFRKVIYTGIKTQFTVMSIPPGGDVGKETHKRVEQVFFCVAGKGTAKVAGIKRPINEGDVLVVPWGVEHNITNTGSSPLKFYTSYSPPNHLSNVVHATKADAEADKADEKFGASIR